MMAAGDVRCATLLFVMADREVRDAPDESADQALRAGRMWYLFRLLCSHLSEAGDVLATLLGTVSPTRLRELLRGRPVEVEDFERLRTAVGQGTYVRKARHAVGSHYNLEDIKRVYERDLRDGRIDSSLIACDVTWLSRFTITDVLALRLLDDAAEATTQEQFSARSGEVTQLALDLVPAVDHLVAGLLKERGVQATVETVEVPALLRVAFDRLEHERRSDPPGA